MSSVSSKTLLNNRLLAMLLLGFSSGLPLALTNSTLQAWFTKSNINIVAIGALSLLGIPYTIKFLWAPLMDHYSLRWFGKRRGWIILMQLGVAITLLILSTMEPSTEAKAMGFVALVVAFFSASQDIAIDAYRTDILHPEERGLGASYFVFAYRIAMLVSGGLALISADYLGWAVTYQLMALLILISMLPTYLAPPTAETPSAKHLYQTIYDSFFDFLQRDKVVLILLFIVLYKIGDAFALSLMTPFLIKGLGFSLTEIGSAYKLVSIVAIILGGFAGGLILLRWPIYRALLVFGLAQSFSNLAFAVLAIVGKNFFLMASAIFIENFCSGLSTAAFFAFLMSLCNQRYSATQYALLSAIASVGRVFLGPIAGVIVQNIGWVQFFIWSFILCLPGLLVLVLLKDKVLQHAQVAAD